MTRNRKTFMSVVQAKPKKVRIRIYRIKQNKPVYIGFLKLRKMFKSIKERDYAIVNFLKYNGHVLAHHNLGNEFVLETI